MTRPGRRPLALLTVLVLGLGGVTGCLAHGGSDSGPTSLAGSGQLHPAVSETPASAGASPSARSRATARPAAAPAATRARTKAADRAEAAKRKVLAAKTAHTVVNRSAKKGASTWKSAGMRAAFADSGVSWFYTWGADRAGVQAPADVGFVPMIWGEKSVTESTLATAKRNGKVLLGFNEPDLAAQSNLSVDRALELWPTLEATGMRLGAPAVAWGADQPGGWLDRFMAGAERRGYDVDFVPLHWYGSDFRPQEAVGQLRGYLQATHARYGKPIWLTEFALMSFTGGQRYPSATDQATFVRLSTAMLQGLPYVERYAWFSTPTPDQGGDGTGLYRPDGSRTPVGSAYRAAG